MTSSYKHLISFLIILLVIIFLTYILSIESLSINEIPIVYLFTSSILILNSTFFLHSYIYKTDIFFDLVGSLSFLSIGVISLLLIPNIDANQILVFMIILKKI